MIKTLQQKNNYIFTRKNKKTSEASYHNDRATSLLINIDNYYYCFSCRAVNEARTRDPQLGKLVLYQLSYYRKKLFLEPIPGLEPGTYSLRMNCSTN